MLIKYFKINIERFCTFIKFIFIITVLFSKNGLQDRLKGIKADLKLKAVGSEGPLAKKEQI